MDIATTITISDKDLGSLFINAFEGGYSPWLRDAELVSSDYIPDPERNLIWWGHDELYQGEFCMLLRYWAEGDPTGEEDEQLEVAYITRAVSQKGLQILADKYPHIFTNIITGNDDALDADAFLQCAIFGEIIYG